MWENREELLRLCHKMTHHVGNFSGGGGDDDGHVNPSGCTRVVLGCVKAQLMDLNLTWALIFECFFFISNHSAHPHNSQPKFMGSVMG
jgi:hypothetical protein